MSLWSCLKSAWDYCCNSRRRGQGQPPRSAAYAQLEDEDGIIKTPPDEGPSQTRQEIYQYGLKGAQAATEIIVYTGLLTSMVATEYGVTATKCPEKFGVQVACAAGLGIVETLVTITPTVLMLDGTFAHLKSLWDQSEQLAIKIAKGLCFAIDLANIPALLASMPLAAMDISGQAIFIEENENWIRQSLNAAAFASQAIISTNAGIHYMIFYFPKELADILRDPDHHMATKAGSLIVSAALSSIVAYASVGSIATATGLFPNQLQYTSFLFNQNVSEETRSIIAAVFMSGPLSISLSEALLALLKTDAKSARLKLLTLGPAIASYAIAVDGGTSKGIAFGSAAVRGVSDTNDTDMAMELWQEARGYQRLSGTEDDPPPDFNVDPHAGPLKNSPAPESKPQLSSLVCLNVILRTCVADTAETPEPVSI